VAAATSTVGGGLAGVVQVEQQGAGRLVRLRERALHALGQPFGAYVVAVAQHRLTQGGQVPGGPVVNGGRWGRRTRGCRR
jgi:hypothetical protein